MKFIRYACLLFVLTALFLVGGVHKAYAATALTCPAGRSLNVVAHEDDDLLFMNPDVLHDIQAGKCVRTIFLTAGDAGKGWDYWLSREDGMHAAYAEMAGTDNSWTVAAPTVAGHTITQATLQGDPRVSLVFLRLPDGGRGASTGFASTNYESLRQLWQGALPELHAVDGSASYTRGQLTDLLAREMIDYRADTIRALDFTALYNDADGADHADHLTSAYFTQVAQAASGVPSHQFSGYRGYSVAEEYPNVEGEALASKQAAFFAYDQYGARDCMDVEVCDLAMGNYLHRQYPADSLFVAGSAPIVPVAAVSADLQPVAETTAPAASPDKLACHAVPITGLALIHVTGNLDWSPAATSEAIVQPSESRALPADCPTPAGPPSV